MFDPCPPPSYNHQSTCHVIRKHKNDGDGDGDDGDDDNDKKVIMVEERGKKRGKDDGGKQR